MPIQELILTDADKLILSAMKTVVQGLGAYLGCGCEIVLHSLEHLDSSAIEVVNGFHSGRTVGAPITNLALEMLEEIERSGEKRPLTYFNKNKDNITLKSATIPIIGEHQRIIGLLCINFYTDISLETFLTSLIPPNTLSPESPRMVETFTQDLDEVISESVSEIRTKVMEDSEISPANKNKEIVIRLEEKGIFNIKDAVIKVADQLELSKNTVYMHLRNIRK